MIVTQNGQLILPGCEDFIPAPRKKQWNPRPHTLERVKVYLGGFAAHGHKIFARRKYMAQKLGLSLRTFCRYLAHLIRAGWLKTVKRTPRVAVREVSGTSLGTPMEVTPRGSRFRREIPSPLVIFRNIYRTVAGKTRESVADISERVVRRVQLRLQNAGR